MKYILSLGILWFLFSNCNDPSTIGAEFLEDDEIAVGFLDTLPLTVSTKINDSVLVYSIGQTVLRTFICGRLEDPLLGKSQAQIYSQVAIISREPDFVDATLDSVILSLAIDTLGVYAQDTSKTLSIEVHRVIEDMDINAATYSNQQYEVGDKLGSLDNFKLDINSSITVPEPQVGGAVDTVTYEPHLRIPLSAEFGKELIDLDTTDLTTAATFGDYFKGIRIQMTEGAEGTIGFDMDVSISRLSVYYTKNDDSRRYDFDLSNLNKRTVSYQHNYASAPVESFINDPIGGDSLIFLQALGGLNADLTVNNLESLPDNIIVNKAELILTQAELPGDEIIFSPSDQLITFNRNSEGNLVWVNDVFPVFNDPRFIEPISGGFIIRGENSITYRLNLSGHIQRMINGEVDNRIELGVHPNNENASRVVLYGPGNSVSPAKLAIVYTLKP